MQEDFENTLQEYEGKLSTAQHDLSIAQSKAQNYMSELDELKSKTSKQDELRQKEIKILEDSVKSAKAHARNKEEEFNYLKNDELKRAKDRASRLEEKIIEMENDFEQKEISGAVLVDGLEKKLKDISNQVERLEKDKSSMMTEHTKRTENLEAKISSAEMAYIEIKTEMTSKLADRDATITKLRKEYLDLENTVQVDLDQLIQAYEKSKLDHSTQMKKMQAEQAAYKHRTETEAALFQKDYDTLQSLAAETEEKLELCTVELKRTKDALDEKKRVLTEMVECQKVTEQELKEAKEIIAELQETSEKFSNQSEDYQGKLQALHKQLQREINKYEDALETRDKTIEELTQKNNKMEKEINEMTVIVKSTEELKAANFLLQDKVERQENFLKRKLEKEHKQRQVPQLMVGSPPKTNVRSRSVTKRPVAPPPPVPTPRSMTATSSTDELEDLLS